MIEFDQWWNSAAADSYRAANPDMGGRDVEPVWDAAQALAPSATDARIELLRGVLLWALWHHQDAASPVGQPIRRVLGMGAHDVMTAALTRKASDAAASIMTPNV